ncbi:MAG: hypothetical protein PHD30_05875, partial [Paludibacter sp.]|nr:hypothetical protein [Paludibacter sp.]
ERSVYSRNWINNPSQPSVIKLTLNGNWQLSEQSEYIRIVSTLTEETTFELSCQHGLTREVILQMIPETQK